MCSAATSRQSKALQNEAEAGRLTVESEREQPTKAGRVERVVLHPIAGPPRLANRVERSIAPYCDLSSLVGPFAQPIARVSGATHLIEEAEQGLPTGAATPEAVAIRLRRDGAELSWGAPVVISDANSLVEFSRSRGASSVELMRADPSLLSEMQLGAFFQAYWRRRVLRRTACRLGLPRSGRWAPGTLLRFALDTAFWIGVRSVATPQEWARLARSSYVVLYYHRIAGEQRAGFEHLDIRPRKFDRQLRLLQLLGFRPLSPSELLAFHSNPSATLPNRRYVIAADDGYRDAVAVFHRYGHLHPQVFVCTSAVGGSAWWTDNEPLATWEELRELQAAGAVVGSHARGHPRLAYLAADELHDELAGSLQDLDTRLPGSAPLLAYPHGLYDENVRSVAAAVGYRAAFTTEAGRNGAGTDVYCLRRVGIKDWDGPVALLWKAVTGEYLPWLWERWRQRFRAARASRRSSDGPEG